MLFRSMRVHDRVTNRGNTSVPHMLLYQCNVGWPLVDEGTDIVWQGDWQAREQGDANRIFREGNQFRKCPPPLTEHNGGGEKAAFINIDADEQGRCNCGLYNYRLGIALAVRLDLKSTRLKSSHYIASRMPSSDC